MVVAGLVLLIAIAYVGREVGETSETDRVVSAARRAMADQVRFSFFVTLCSDTTCAERVEESGEVDNTERSAKITTRTVTQAGSSLTDTTLDGGSLRGPKPVWLRITGGVPTRAVDILDAYEFARRNVTAVRENTFVRVTWTRHAQGRDVLAVALIDADTGLVRNIETSDPGIVRIAMDYHAN